jgi:signal transduction histidine kinase
VRKGDIFLRFSSHDYEMHLCISRKLKKCMRYSVLLKTIPIYLFSIFILVQNCLGQFPGYYVQHFNSENGLPNTIKGLQQDNNGFLWLATEGGLVRFDGRRFKMYDRSETGESINRLYGVGLTKDGKIFIQVENRSYYYLSDANTLRPMSEKLLFKHGEQFTSTTVTAARLYNRCRNKYNAKITEEWTIPGILATRHTYLNSVVSAGGFYYYLNNSGEVVVADTALNSFCRPRLIENGAVRKCAGANDTTAITLIERDNKIYLRWGINIFRLDFSLDKKTALMIQTLHVGTISNIMGLLQMPESKITVVATVADGIYLFQEQAFNSLIFPNREANVFYAQAPFENDGSITEKGVLFPGKIIPFDKNYFYASILKTKNDSYFLDRRDRDTSSICVLNSHLKVVREIPDNRGGIFCFRQLKDNSVWLVSDSGFLGSIFNDSIKWLKRPPGLPRDFHILTFLEASANQFWIAGGKGMAKVDVTTQAVNIIPELVNINVRSLYKDVNGVIWIGTYGNGFYAWFKNNLVSFPIDRNGYLKYVHTFLPDKSGRLWLSTNHGIFAFDLNDLYFYFSHKKDPPVYYYFDNTAGFPSNELNGGCTPAGIVLGNGKFSLPSLNGLIQFYPDSIKISPPNASIFIDGITADTSIVDYTNNHITIPANTNRLLVFVSSPYFGNGYNQNIQFKMNESDTWIDMNEDFIIELNNINHGSHTIFLRKQAGFGRNNFITKELKFMVKPAFSETLLYKLIILSTILLFFYLLFRLRIRFLVDQKTRLEKEVSEKTKEQDALINNLETVVEELEQSKDDLQKTAMFKETLAMIITHDLQSPLRFLSNALNRLHNIHEDSDDEVRELSDELVNTSANIYHFVEDFSIWISKVNMAGNLNVEAVNIHELFSELEIFFSELLKIKGNQIIAESSPTINVCADYQLLKTILRNIIDNANKHTVAGTIGIIARVVNNIVTIKITDNGEGMKTAMLQKLRIRTQWQSSFQYSKEIDGIGLGFRFVTDFCRLLDMSINIESQLAEGTTVTFSGLVLCD